nr:hypothetical protein [uncultured Prevotella sp.]
MVVENVRNVSVLIGVLGDVHLPRFVASHVLERAFLLFPSYAAQQFVIEQVFRGFVLAILSPFLSYAHCTAGTLQGIVLIDRSCVWTGVVI